MSVRTDSAGAGDASGPAPAREHPKTTAQRALKKSAVAVYTSSRARRALPVTAAFRLIDAAASLARRMNAPAWQESRRFHQQLLLHTPLRGNEDDVAQEAVAEFLRIMEIFWRPWLMRRGEVADADNYWSVQSQGRAVLLAFPHFGLTYAAAPTFHRAGLNVYTVLSPHHRTASGDSFDDRLARRANEYVDELGQGHNMAGRGGSVKAEGTFARMQELLEAGNTVAIAWSMPGSMPTPFLGRRLSLASGPAKLAFAGDAVVVPYVNQRRGTTSIVRFGTPLDPREFDDPAALQAAIARQIESWALAHPEAVWSLSQQKGGPPLINGPALTPDPAAARQ